MVLANRNLSVKVRVCPVGITAKTVTARNVNAMFIAAIFFCLPEVRDAFKLGNFPLNQVTIKLGLGLSTTSAAVSIVEATLEQKPVERLVHKQLASSFSIVKSFRVTRIGGGENDKGNIITSVAGTAAVVIAINDVEGVTGSQSRAAIISFRITHR